jgi:hypothetical protein
MELYRLSANGNAETFPNAENQAGFEVLIAVPLKNYIFLDKTP